MPQFLQYVSVLRKCKLREKLRSARQSMQERYPLTESLWLEWLEDEVATLDQTKAADILELFQIAVKDYLSVQIWAAYIK